MILIVLREKKASSEHQRRGIQWRQRTCSVYRELFTTKTVSILESATTTKNRPKKGASLEYAACLGRRQTTKKKRGHLAFPSLRERERGAWSKDSFQTCVISKLDSVTYSYTKFQKAFNLPRKVIPLPAQIWPLSHPSPSSAPPPFSLSLLPSRCESAIPSPAPCKVYMHSCNLLTNSFTSSFQGAQIHSKLLTLQQKPPQIGRTRVCNHGQPK